jgi:PEP-CTERM motif
MRRFVLAAATVAPFAVPVAAPAALLATIGQSVSAPTVFATDNGTTTHININSADISVTQQIEGSTPDVFMDLHATSVGPASTALGGIFVAQSFDGNFCLTSGPSCSGTDLLSGTFTDAVFGAGHSLTVSASEPPGTVAFHSDVIKASFLTPPNALSLSFVNVIPSVHEHIDTLGAFEASISGNFSSTAAAVPEPASLALLGVGLLGLALTSRKRRSPPG